MRYRVVMKVSYHERYFDFDDANDALAFAEMIVEHDVTSEDHAEKTTEVAVYVIKEVRGDE